MHRVVAFLLFFGLLPFASSSSYFEFDHQFSTTFSPCENFYEFVCNPNGNENTSFVNQMLNNFKKEMISSLSNYSDSIIDFLRAKLYAIYDFNKGEDVGKATAIGNSSLHVVINVAKATMEIVDIDALGQAIEPIECFYNHCPLFIQGFVSGFMKHVAPNMFDWKIEAKYVEIEARLTDKEKMVDQTVFASAIFTPYLNLLMAKVATEKSLWIPKHLEEELNHIGDVLIKETVAQLQKQAWIPEDRKTKAIQLMKAIKKVLVLDAATKDLGNIEKALEFFSSRFDDGKEAYMSEKNCTERNKTNCFIGQILDLQGLINDVSKDYKTQYEQTDNFVGVATIGEPLFSFNAFTNYEKMVIQPGLQFYMMEDLPVGLRWSAVATMFAHEIYHSLDPLHWDETEKASTHLVGLPEYDEAAKCYSDYYGSLGATASNGTIFYPNGTVKSGEGFSDVEGTRIMLKVLEKTLFSGRAFKSSYSYSTYNDLEWFFLGSQIWTCTPKDDFTLFKLQPETEPHPRSTVRMNAVARQLEEFSDVFRCKPGDPMYVVENPCKAFPNL